MIKIYDVDMVKCLLNNRSCESLLSDKDVFVKFNDGVEEYTATIILTKIIQIDDVNITFEDISGDRCLTIRSNDRCLYLPVNSYSYMEVR